MEKEDLIYEPEVGLTIPEAFARAILMAKRNGKTVHTLVNDIEMDITAKTNLKRAVASYRKKNQEQYEAAMHAQSLRQKRSK